MADTASEPRSDALSITIDGKSLDARPGELLIAAAERNGIYIPRFCWHPRMKPVGMCRMCLVEMESPRGPMLVPACTTPVNDGMVVNTRSETVRKVQDGVLEYLLINHPLDCPVCDRGGECPLQDQTFSYGPGESRFVEEKRHFEKPIAISPLVYLDRERCIQCARCVRFADQVAGDPLIQFVERGNQTQVLTFPDEPFNSYFSGNTVQICPVGALTARPYRFRARPWDLEQVESTCTMCAVGCRVLVQSSSDRITRKLGIDSDPVNHGWLCDKGRFDYEGLGSDERLSAPLVRDGDQLVEAAWGEALDVAADGIRRALEAHGADSIAVLGGARLTNEDAYAWTKLSKGIIGTDNVDAQMGDGLPADVVLGLPRATIDEACSASALILLGPDLKEELPVLYLRLREAVVDQGVPLVQITPQESGLTRHASVSLPYRPGEAPVLARALAGGTSVDVAGAGAADITRARDLLGSHPVVVLGRASLAEHSSSIAEAAGALAAIPGVKFLSSLRRGNVHGALDMGLSPGLLPGRVSLDDGREWFAEAWPTLPVHRGLDAAGILDAAAAGRIHALVLLGADPLSDFPDRALARRALTAAGFVVSVDIFLNESSQAADVVLAAAAWGEKRGTTTNIEGRVSRLSQKITPPGTSRADWSIAVELAWRLGHDLGFESHVEAWDEIERLAPVAHGVTIDLLRRPEMRDGVVVPLGGVQPSSAGVLPEEARAVGEGATSEAEPASVQPAAEGEAPTGTQGAPDRSGAPSEIDRPGPEPARPAPVAFEAPVAGSAPPPVDAYSLRLVSRRTLYDAGVVVQHAASLAGLAPGPRLRINPYDLDRLGVTTGGQVRVSSARTSMVLAVQADLGVPRGSASLVFNQPGAAAAELIDVTAPVTDLRLETI